MKRRLVRRLEDLGYAVTVTPAPVAAETSNSVPHKAVGTIFPREEWTACVREAMGHLSKPQVTVLALFRLGMVVAQSCAVTAIAAVLAVACHRPLANASFVGKPRPRRAQNAGKIVVESCFVPLLCWVVGRWQGTQLALALDATTLGDRFVVLALSVVDRGCAIPVAWTIVTAGEKRAWRREWLRMLRLLHPAVPSTWTVLVLARPKGRPGLDARWLFRRDPAGAPAWAGIGFCGSTKGGPFARRSTPALCP